MKLQTDGMSCVVQRSNMFTVMCLLPLLIRESICQCCLSQSVLSVPMFHNSQPLPAVPSIHHQEASVQEKTSVWEEDPLLSHSVIQRLYQWVLLTHYQQHQDKVAASGLCAGPVGLMQLYWNPSLLLPTRILIFRIFRNVAQEGFSVSASKDPKIIEIYRIYQSWCGWPRGFKTKDRALGKMRWVTWV